MRDLDDVTLMAYADGELDSAAAALVEARAARSAEIGRRIREFLQTRALLQAAMAAPMHEPAPRQATALLGAVAALASTAPKVVPLPRRARPELGLALAAGLAALMVGFGGGLTFYSALDRSAGGEALQAAARSAAIQAVALALETSPNGRAVPWQSADGAPYTITPLRTFMTDRGEICREYRLAGPNAETAVACRDEAGRWRPRAILPPGA